MVVELAVIPTTQTDELSDVPVDLERVVEPPTPVPGDRDTVDSAGGAKTAPQSEVSPKSGGEAADLRSGAADAHAAENAATPAIPAPVLVKSAAPVQSRNNAAPSEEEQNWEGRVLAKLVRGRRYPGRAQSAGQEDTVLLRLVIDRRGRLIEASVRKSAGYALLDDEVLALARRVSPFPEPPESIPGDRIVRVVPVEFYIRRHN